MYARVFSADDLPARINSRLLSQYKGQTVRLTAKVLKLSGDTATVQASDGGEVSRSTEWRKFAYRSDWCSSIACMCLLTRLSRPEV